MMLCTTRCPQRHEHSVPFKMGPRGCTGSRVDLVMGVTQKGSTRLCRVWEKLGAGSCFGNSHVLPAPSEIPPSTSSNPANIQNFHWIMTYYGLVGNKQQYYIGTIFPCSLLTLNPTQQTLDIYIYIHVYMEIMVPFGIPSITRHLIFRVPKKRDHNFDNHPVIP